MRARWTTSQIARLAGERWKSSTEMWNLNSLFASDPIRTMITQDAAEADVIVVAMSSLDRRARLHRAVQSRRANCGRRRCARHRIRPSK